MFSTAGAETGRGEKAGNARATESNKSAQPEVAPQKDGVRLVQDPDSGRTLVEILDRKTGEVIYQLPPEELQKLAEQLKQFTGTVIDTVV